MLKRLGIILWIGAIAGIAGCSMQDIALEADAPRLTEFTYGECKERITRTISEQSEILRYRVGEDGTAEFAHLNAKFNCEPGRIYATLAIEGDRLIISEHEASSRANCYCPYDLSFKIALPDPEMVYTVVLKQFGIIRHEFVLNGSRGAAGEIAL